MNRNSNPVFQNMEKKAAANTYGEVNANTAAWKGIIAKIFLLVAIALGAGFGTIFLPIQVVIPMMIIGPIASFILVIIAMRNPARARMASLFYALAQGITYGAITWFVESALPGVGVTALGITFGIVLVMAGLHSIGAVRATPRLIRFVMGSLVAVLITSFVFLILSFAAPTLLQAFTGNYTIMILVSAFLILLGAFMLIIDFDNAKNVVESGAPQVYEWQVSLGIMVTIVWIYLQVLRLLITIFANRD